MQTRPNILILTTIFFCLEPLAKIIFYSILENVNWFTLLEYQFYKLSFIDFFLTFALMPVTGVALYFAKKWSYILFILTQLYLIFTHGSMFFSAEYQPHYNSLTLSISFFIVNLIILFSFLLTNTRMVFLNTALRFWETAPRYLSDLEIIIFQDGNETKSKSRLINISKSGAFISNNTDLGINKVIKIRFTINDDDFSFHALTIHKSTINNIEGYGVKFINLSDIKKIQLTFLVQAHAKIGKQIRNEKDILEKTFHLVLDLLKKIIKLPNTSRNRKTIKGESI